MSRPTAAELKARFHWLETHDLAAGSLGLEGEGWFDAYALLQEASRRKARSLGVEERVGEVVEALLDGDRASGVRLADDSEIEADWVRPRSRPWPESSWRRDSASGS